MKNAPNDHYCIGVILIHSALATTHGTFDTRSHVSCLPLAASQGSLELLTSSSSFMNTRTDPAHSPDALKRSG